MAEKLGPIFKEEGVYVRAAIFKSLRQSLGAYFVVDRIVKQNPGATVYIEGNKYMQAVVVIGLGPTYAQDERIKKVLSKGGEIKEIEWNFVDFLERKRRAKEVSLSMEKRLTNLS